MLEIVLLLIFSLLIKTILWAGYDYYNHFTIRQLSLEWSCNLSKVTQTGTNSLSLDFYEQRSPLYLLPCSSSILSKFSWIYKCEMLLKLTNKPRLLGERKQKGNGHFPSSVFSISCKDTQAGSSILRPLPQWNWLAQLHWHAWHHPYSCWHGPLPGRSKHQSQAVMPSCPSGLLYHSRSGKWQECKLLLVTGEQAVKYTEPCGLSAGCFKRLWLLCMAALVRVREQMTCSRPSSIMDVWHLVSNDRPSQEDQVLPVTPLSKF